MSTRKVLLAGMAAALLAASLSQFQPIYGKQSPWDVHIKAAQDALHAGNYTEARTQLDLALEDTHKFQNNDPRLAETYFCLGELNRNQMNYGEAKQFYERALQLQQQIPGFDEVKLADTLWGLAKSTEMTGDRQLAMILLKRVREIWTKKYGANSPQLLKVLKPLGIYATVATDYPSAEQCYRELVRVEEQTGGSRAPETASALNLLSMTLARVGKYSEAAPLAERAVGILAGAPEYSAMYEQAADNLLFINSQLGKATPIPQPVQTAPPAEKPIITVSTPAPVKQASVEKPAAPDKPAATANKPTTGGPQAARTQTAQPTQPTAPTTSAAPPAVARPPVTRIVDLETKAELKGSSSTVTQTAMRPPAASIPPDSSEFRPWEIKTSANAIASNPTQAEKPSKWDKIRYLAGGRLITKEEYEALLLANEAYELIRQEKYRMACDILRKALAVCPTLASAHTNLGLALSEQGDTNAAIEELKQAIAIDAGKSAPWVNLASAFQNSGQLRAAIATYDEFVKRFPNHHLTPKAREIVAHLQKEVQEQQAVELAMRDKNGGTATMQDYFAYASHPGEMRWPSSKSTIRVYVASADNTPGYRSEYAGFCQDAFKEWSTASGGKLAFDFVKRQDDADITWNWTNDLTKVSSIAEGGEANVRASNKQISHADITVLTTNGSVDTPLSPNQLRAVCLHEIGHALGLIGHSPKPDDVMFCSMPPAMTKPVLSQRDVGTIQKLYSMAAVGWVRDLLSWNFADLARGRFVNNFTRTSDDRRDLNRS
jgi:tetratricopeptide (TPR) repeat protein